MADFASTVLRGLSRKLVRQLQGQVTDDFVELLLGGMKLAFLLSRDYRENLRGFTGAYVLRTTDGAVATSATFRDGKMKVHEQAVPDWNVRISFRNPQAVWSFLLSRDQDVLSSILRDEVEVEGNLNYVYKLGFMARELTRRLGMPA